MKFTGKVFCATLIVIALAFGIGSYLLVAAGFDGQLKREVSRSLEEHVLLRFALETAAVNAPKQDGVLTDESLASVVEQLEGSQSQTGRGTRLTNRDNGTILYQNEKAKGDAAWTQGIADSEQLYQIIRDEEGGSYIQVACAISVGGRKVVLETIRNITEVFGLRDQQYRVYQRLTLLILAVSALVMAALSRWLTRPIRILSRTTRHIADGQYAERAPVLSQDEIGDFTRSFNRMADALEERLRALEEVARQREEFVGNFAHELKTPLTSIIGYADMLRSQDLDEESRFKAASYIFSEGKRLESLSLKLMDLMVLRKQQFDFKRVGTLQLAQEIQGLLVPVMDQYGLSLQLQVQEAVIRVEPDLFRTLLLNLIDNARKASEAGSAIELHGYREGEAYAFYVADHGRGIPPEELDKITEAFYMVDKSRARAQHGAGMGLALCEEIAQLHHTHLEFDSVVGVGTTVRIAVEMVVAIRGRRRR